MAVTVSQLYANAGTTNVSQSITTSAGTNKMLVAIVFQRNSATAGEDSIARIQFGGQGFTMFQGNTTASGALWVTSIWGLPYTTAKTANFIYDRSVAGTERHIILLDINFINPVEPINISSYNQADNTATPPLSEVSYSNYCFIINATSSNNPSHSAYTANSGWTIGNSGTPLGGVSFRSGYVYREYTGSGTTTGAGLNGVTGGGATDDWSTVTVALGTNVAAYGTSAFNGVII
jgi:hypothetical protein